MCPDREDAIDSARALAELHAAVDREAEALARVHAGRLQCRRGCAGCCVDDLTVTRIEAEGIRRAHPELLASGEPHPVGACAFLDGAGACRVYAERPLVCRTQGLPLRLFFEDEAGEIEERRDICPLNQAGGPPLDRLSDDALWLVGVHELRLTTLDEAHGGSEETRVRLRDLFAASSPAGRDPAQPGSRSPDHCSLSATSLFAPSRSRA